MGQESIIIIGGGVFGVSTSFHLSRAHHTCSVKIFDRELLPNPKAASFDINKVVRAAYDDIAHCRLATRNLKKWRTDPLFKQWYHAAEMLYFLPHKGGARKILENLKRIGFEEGAEIITPDQVRARFDGIFRNANFGNAEELLLDPHTGWLDATEALTATLQIAKERGVEHIPKSVSRLIIENGVCRGAETPDGMRYKAHKVLLSAGAETARILADSAPNQLDLHSGSRFVAAAIIVAKVRLTAEQRLAYKSTAGALWDEEPVKGEVMPVTEDGYLKFIRDIPLKNTVFHPQSGSWISRPPEGKEGTEWTDPEHFPPKLRNEMSEVIEGIFGPEAAESLQPEALRLCWEPMAPDENWFVTPHPRCEGLYIATAGTGHAWKYLPVIGELIVDMLLEPEKFQQHEMSKMWAWDRELVDSPDEDVIPRRELVDMI